jgi:tol-pal system protein YbgF
MTRALWSVAALMVLASGCGANAKTVRQLQAELETLKGELTTLRQAHDIAFRDAAAWRGSVQALESELAGLRGAVAETADGVRQITGRVARLEASAPTPVAVAVPVPLSTPPAERPARDGTVRGTATRAPAAETAYQAALANFRAREYGQAVLDFLDFVAKHPKHSLAASAQYWIGEAYYIQQDWRQSLVEFERVFRHNPPDGRAADALLKIGLCHANLREAARARAAWQRVVREHPDSDAAAKAGKLLSASRAPAPR